MKEESLQEWLENPVTEYFFKYLQDQIKDTSTLLAERISNGGVVPIEEQIELATECLTMKRVTEVTYEEINEYYLDKER